MFKTFFCLDCEENFEGTHSDETCPSCGGVDIVEDNTGTTSDEPEWDNDHYEGNLSVPSSSRNNDWE